MKGLETGRDKIQKICDAIKKETLEPAKQEAREILENAHLKASDIVKEAERRASSLIEKAEKEIEEKRRVAQASLQLAFRQSIEQLKQKIEEQLFQKGLDQLVAKEMSDPKVIAHLLQALMRGLEEKGLEEEVVAILPKAISPRAVTSVLAAQMLERLKEPVAVGDFAGGVQLQLKGQKITIDISDGAVRELVAQYTRRDFRDLVFGM